MMKSVPQHAKFKRLVRKLRPLVPQGLIDAETIAVGLLERLWHVAATSTPAGDIGKLDDELLCEMIGWVDTSHDLIGTLVECGWIDRDPVHRLLIHDWDEHCPDWIKANMKRWSKQFAEPTKELTKEPTSVSTHSSLLGQAPLDATPNHTIPNHTNHTSPNPSGGRRKFSIPTVDEVAAYCLERQNGIDAEEFVAHYEANGWVQGRGKPVRDWHACVVTWEKQRAKEANRPGRTPSTKARLMTPEENEEFKRDPTNPKWFE